MQIDPAFVSAISALVGALMGGGASLAAAIYTQRYQNRLQRIARETAKREQVYADFIMDASKLLLMLMCMTGSYWAATNSTSSGWQTECGSLLRRLSSSKQRR